MLDPEGSEMFPASHLSLISLFIVLFPLYCLTWWECSHITGFPDESVRQECRNHEPVERIWDGIPEN